MQKEKAELAGEQIVALIRKLTEDEVKEIAKLFTAAPELFAALDGIMSIGKRDMSNPKYDSYFETAREVLARLHSNG